ncbi:MAG TPA: arginase family protein [Nitrososphaera sp.]|nr:arginase family protein [Nitrososphaera sp.]
MERLHRSNTSSVSDAQIVIIGVPDESGSHAKRRGAASGTGVLRAAWNEFEFFERHGKLIPICPMEGKFEGKQIYDMGDIEKKDLSNLVHSLVAAGKIPVIIGGDHSVSTQAITGAGRAISKKMPILYFDAHPDFVSSTRDYYGSVLADSESRLNLRKSCLIGTRAAEPEELKNAKAAGIDIITPLNISEQGLRRTAARINSRAGRAKAYVSIDLDCLDPAFAPGVSVPSPCGLRPVELVYLIKKFISQGNIAALDMVELSPDYDFNGITASLAAKILSECIASIRV